MSKGNPLPAFSSKKFCQVSNFEKIHIHEKGGADRKKISIEITTEGGLFTAEEQALLSQNNAYIQTLNELSDEQLQGLYKALLKRWSDGKEQG